MLPLSCDQSHCITVRQSVSHTPLSYRHHHASKVVPSSSFQLRHLFVLTLISLRHHHHTLVVIPLSSCCHHTVVIIPSSSHFRHAVIIPPLSFYRHHSSSSFHRRHCVGTIQSSLSHHAHRRPGQASTTGKWDDTRVCRI